MDGNHHNNNHQQEQLLATPPYVAADSKGMQRLLMGSCATLVECTVTETGRVPFGRLRPSEKAITDSFREGFQRLPAPVTRGLALWHRNSSKLRIFCILGFSHAGPWRKPPKANKTNLRKGQNAAPFAHTCPKHPQKVFTRQLMISSRCMVTPTSARK